MPKRSRSGLVSSPARVVAPTSVNFGKSILHRPRRRAFADHQIELKILHRRIEDFFDGRVQPVNFVDEEHVALFEIGQKRREIAGLRDHRARCRAEADAKFLGHDLRQRRLAEPRRPGKKHVIERIAASARRLNEDAEIGARLLLADELVERLRADRRLEGVHVLSRTADEPVGHGLFVALFARGVKTAAVQNDRSMIQASRAECRP